MSRWKCYICSEAESYDLICKLETPTADEPTACPITGEETDWVKVEAVGDSPDTPSAEPC